MSAATPSALPSPPEAVEECLDAARDALVRYRRRSGDSHFEANAHIEGIGDLDDDGVGDVAVTFVESCGNHLGCGYYFYLRSAKNRPNCDRFVGAADGAAPLIVEAAHHGLHDFHIMVPHLYGETQERLSFDGVRYLKDAERERSRDEISHPWSPWSEWKTLPKAVSAEDP